MKNLYHAVISLVILSILSFNTAVKADSPNYEKKTLPNGIQLIYKILPNSPTVTARFVVPVGFLDEPRELRGISHLLEHLIYRGSAKYPAEAFQESILEMGGEYNGSTWLDYTEFHMVMPTEHYLQAFNVYADCLFHPELDEKTVELEKKIVMVEKSIRKSPGSIEWLYISQLTDDRFDYNVANVQRNDLIQYHQKHYLPNQMTLILTGSFQLDEVIKCLSNYGDRSKPAYYNRPVTEIHPVDLDLQDFLQGEQYKIVFSFDLDKLNGKDLTIAKVLPYLLYYESGNYDNATNRSLEYEPWFLNYGSHYGLALFYRDCQETYSPEMDAWHKKNLERYCKFLKAKNFDRFLKTFRDVVGRSYQTMDSDSYNLNNYYFSLRYEPTAITENDLNTMGNLQSSDFKGFVQKYLEGKPYHKIIIRTIQE
ncbi:MAG TPA: pitrilysin family protein [Bacillota bacterium]|nr:pitrilysin family protein [Bacillota bacterium]